MAASGDTRLPYPSASPPATFSYDFTGSNAAFVHFKRHKPERELKQMGPPTKEHLMRTRTKLFVSALIASAAMAGAIPAQAQNYPQQHNYPQQGYPQSQDGRYDTNRDGRIDDRDGRYDNRDDRYDNRDGRYDNRDGRYDNRDDRYDNRYDRNNQYRGNANAIWTQIEQLQRRVARNDNRDRISEREAAGLRNAVYQLRMQFRDYNRNGLTQRESRYLQDRINQVRSRLQYERQDNNGRRY